MLWIAGKHRLLGCSAVVLWLFIPPLAGQTGNGVIAFSQSSYSVPKSADSVWLPVTRSGGTSGAVSISFVARTGSAINGVHFVAQEGVVSFADGVDTPHPLGFAIINNPEQTTTLHFTVTLSSPQGGAQLGVPSDARVNIIDDAAEISNPLVLGVRRVTDSRVRLDVRNFSGILSHVLPFLPYVDTIAVWYRTGSYHTQPDRNAHHIVYLSPSHMRESGAQQYVAEVDVVPLPSAADSFYYFSIAPVWHLPAQTRDSIPPFSDFGRDTAIMLDMSPPVMPPQISLDGYFPSSITSQSAYVRIHGVAHIDTSKSMFAIMRSGLSRDFLAPLTVDTLWVPGMVQGAQEGSYLHGMRSERFAGMVDTLRVDVRLLGKNTKVSFSRETFLVRSPPQNPVVLSAHPVTASRIALSWHPLETGVEGLRILVSLLPIPPGKATLDGVDGLVEVLRPAPSSGRDTAINLNTDTPYYFAAQIAQHGLWSNVTEESRASATTLPFTPGATIDNSVVIRHAWYDSAYQRFGLDWTIDEMHREVALYGVSWGTDSLATRFSTPQFRPLEEHRDTTWIVPGEAIRFSTRFYFFVQLRYPDGPPSGHTPDSHVSLVTGPFGFQPVFYFNDNRDSVYAHNGRIVLWPGDGWFDKIVDTLDAAIVTDPPEGFIVVGDGFTFRRGHPSTRFHVGLKAQTIPPPYTFSDVGLYRVAGPGRLRFVYGANRDAQRGIVSTLTNELDMPFVLMIDTQRPRIVAAGDIGAPVAEGEGLSYTLSVSENVENAVVRLLYGRGSQNYSFFRVDTLRAPGASALEFEVPAGMVTTDGGVRALAVIFDGRQSDTLDLSRQVRTESYSAGSAERLRWEPLHVSIDLDEKDVWPVLSRLVDPGGGYDVRHVRLFRWNQGEGSSAQHEHWVEYAPGTNDAFFRLEPGRLMWIKARASRPLQFGAGLTVSLREPVRIPLAPRGWTDISLPFGFPLHLRRILDATGPQAGELQVYHWRETSTSYRAVPLFLPGSADPQLLDRDREMPAGTRTGAYTVYNPSPLPGELVLEPVPYSLSRAGGLTKSHAEPIELPSWSLVARPVDDAGGLCAGYTFLTHVPGSGAGRAFPRPPSLDSRGVSLVDSASGRLLGGYVSRGEPDRGIAYRLFFEASGSYHIDWALQGGALLQAQLWDPITEEGVAVEDGPFTVAAASHKVLLVGTAAFITSYKAAAAPGGYYLGVVYPNPFRGAVRIDYRVPGAAGGSVRVHMRVFDAAGRSIRNLSEPAGGVRGTLRWDGTDADGRRAPAGAYLIEARLLDGGGLVQASHRSRVLRLP